MKEPYDPTEWGLHPVRRGGQPLVAGEPDEYPLFANLLADLLAGDAVSPNDAGLELLWNAADAWDAPVPLTGPYPSLLSPPRTSLPAPPLPAHDLAQFRPPPLAARLAAPMFQAPLMPLSPLADATVSAPPAPALCRPPRPTPAGDASTIAPKVLAHAASRLFSLRPAKLSPAQRKQCVADILKKRSRNTAAARRSRDRRSDYKEALGLRVAELEAENSELRVHADMLAAMVAASP
ncbi:hypothetical protein DFJ74DRAFT_210762 [Hyaloraphidium curvatum]|nr:hypothetical protein DFJ74DRAFT_210762 [Hyaloraphidium curvatum]